MAFIITPPLLLLSAAPVRGRHSGFSVSILFSPLLHCSLTASINLLLGLPRFRFLAAPSSAYFSRYYSQHISSVHVPNHLSLASRTFSPNRPTRAVPLMYSFTILFILVTPNKNLSIFNYVTSSSASCLFVSVAVSSPNNIAGLTATLYTFPFTWAVTRVGYLSHVMALRECSSYAMQCGNFYLFGRKLTRSSVKAKQ